MVTGWWQETAALLDGYAAPRAPTPFQGRKRELADLGSRLRPGMRCTLEGKAAGAGVSALVWEAVRRSGQAFTEVVWWSRGLDGPLWQPALHRWGHQLSAPAPSGGKLVDLLDAIGVALQARADQPVLVVIDDATAEHEPHLRALAERLDGAHALLVTTTPGQISPVGTVIPIEGLTLVDGIALLRRESGVSLPQNDAVALVEEALALPLSLRLLARRLRNHPPTGSDRASPPDVSALDGVSPDRVHGPPLAVPSFLHLYAALPARARRTVRALGALSAGVIRDRHVAALLFTSEQEVLSDLHLAVEQGILDPGPDGTFAAAPIIRQWFGQLLDATGERAEVMTRHTRHFLALGAGPLDERRDGSLLENAADVLVSLRSNDDEAAQVRELATGPEGWAVAAGLLDAIIAPPGRPAAPTPATSRRKVTERRRRAAIEEATSLSLAAEEAAAQAAVWVEGGRADVGTTPRGPVLEALAVLEEAGRHAEQASQACVNAVEAMFAVHTEDELIAAAERVRQSAEAAEAAGEEAEQRWSELQTALQDVEARTARHEASRQQAREQVLQAQQLVADTRESLRVTHDGLPSQLTGHAAEVWAQVTQAMAQAVISCREIEAAADATDGDRVHRARQAVERACEQALQASAETRRIVQMAGAHQEAVDEVAAQIHRAQDASSRLRSLRDRIRQLLADAEGDADAASLLARLDEVERQAALGLAGVDRANEQIRRASAASERNRVLKEARAAAQKVSTQAVDALSLLGEAEVIGHRLDTEGASRALSRIAQRAQARSESLQADARTVEERLAALRQRASTDRSLKRAVDELTGALDRVTTDTERARRDLADAARRTDRQEAEAALTQALGASAAAEESTHSLHAAIDRVEADLASRNTDEIAAQRAEATRHAQAAAQALARAMNLHAEVQRILSPVDADRSREVWERTRSAVDRARYATEHARESAQRVQTAPVGELRRWVGATEVRLRDAEDAVLAAETGLERARELYETWLIERREAAETRRDLAARIERVRIDLTAVGELIDEVTDLTTEPPSERVKIALAAARSVHAAGLAEVRTANDSLQQLEHDLELPTYGAALSRTETSIKNGEEAISAVQESLEGARHAHADAIAERARIAELRQRVRTLVEEAEHVIGAATRAVEAELEALSADPGEEAATTRLEAQRALFHAEQGVVRLRELAILTDQAPDLQGVQDAQGLAEDVAEEVAADAEHGRALAESAVEQAEAEAIRRRSAREDRLAHSRSQVEAAVRQADQQRRALNDASRTVIAEHPAIGKALGRPWKALRGAIKQFAGLCHTFEADARRVLDNPDPEQALDAARSLLETSTDTTAAFQELLERLDAARHQARAWELSVLAHLVARVEEVQHVARPEPVSEDERAIVSAPVVAAWTIAQNLRTAISSIGRGLADYIRLQDRLSATVDLPAAVTAWITEQHQADTVANERTRQLTDAYQDALILAREQVRQVHEALTSQWAAARARAESHLEALEARSARLGLAPSAIQDLRRAVDSLRHTETQLPEDPSGESAQGPAILSGHLDTMRQAEGQLDELSAAWQLAAEVADAAITQAHEEQLAATGAARAACADIVRESCADVHALNLEGEQESLGLMEDEHVREGVQTLARLADALANGQAAMDTQPSDDAEDVDATWQLLLMNASQAGSALSLAARARAASAALAAAVRQVATRRVDQARQRVAESLRDALGADSEASEVLAQARRHRKTWPDEAEVLAATEELERRATALFDATSACFHASSLAAKVASVRQADELANQAADARAQTRASLDALIQAGQQVEHAAEAALTQWFDRQRAEMVELAARVDQTLSRALDLTAQGSLLRRGWSIPEVLDVFDKIQSHADNIQQLRERHEVLLSAASLEQDRDGLASARRELTDLDAAARRLAHEIEEESQLLTLIPDLYLTQQLAVLSRAAEVDLAAADQAVGAAIAARNQGEHRAVGVPGAAVDDALRRLVEQATTTQALLQQARTAVRSVADAPDAAEGLSRRELAARLANEVVEASVQATALRAAVEEAAARSERLEAHKQRQVSALEGRLTDAQVLYDEAELTIEASRSDLEEAPAEVREGWTRAEEELALAARQLWAARRAVVGLQAAQTQDEADMSVALTEEALATVLGACRGLMLDLPELLASQIHFVQDKRDLLEARVSLRRAAARAEHQRRQLTEVVGRVQPETGPLDAAIGQAIAQVHDNAKALDRLRHEVEVEEGSAAASELRRQGEALTTTTDIAWQSALAALIRLETQVVQARSTAAQTGRANDKQLSDAAMAILRERTSLARHLRVWARSVGLWTAGWGESEVVQALADVRHQVAAGLEQDATVVEQIQRALKLGTGGGEALVTAAGAALSDLRRTHDRCLEAVDHLAATLRQAHAMRTAARDAALRHRHDVARATQALTENLGSSRGARRIPLFEKGLAVARLRGDRGTLLGWMIDNADAYIDAGRDGDARRLLVEARPIAVSLGSLREAEVLLRLARIERRLGDAVQASTFAREALERTPSGAEVDAVYAEIGLSELAIGNHQAAIQAFDQAIAAAALADDTRALGVHHGRRARAWRRAGNLSEAVVAAEAAVDLLERAGDAQGLSAETGLLASLRREQGLPADALTLAEQALRLALAGQDAIGVATQRCNVAWCWLSLGNPERASRLFEEARQGARQAGDPAVEGHALSGLAEVARAVATRTPATGPGGAWAASKEVRRRLRRRRQAGRFATLPPVPTAAADAASRWAEAAQISAKMGDVSAERARREEQVAAQGWLDAR